MNLIEVSIKLCAQIEKKEVFNFVAIKVSTDGELRYIFNHFLHFRNFKRNDGQKVKKKNIVCQSSM